MPGKSDAAALSEEAIRQRAYHLWEQDGRPDGRGDHYWHLASEEARKSLVEDTATRTAKLTGGRNPSEMPPEVKSGGKKVKAKSADAPKKSTPKPRAALQKPH